MLAFNILVNLHGRFNYTMIEYIRVICEGIHTIKLEY